MDTGELRDLATRLRRDCIRMTSEAGSGHPTSCLSAADLVAVLFGRVLRFDAAHPADARNDRFVLSKGHAAPLLYAAWAEAGAIPRDSLLGLRRMDSDLEGHPTPRLPWVDVATGSLGQGLSAALGMALAARLDGASYRCFVLLGDGETSEGAVWEAAAVASDRALGNLVAIVDVNRLGQSEPTALGHDVDTYARRFDAFGWRSLPVDGHDLEAIAAAFEEAEHATQPTAIIARTLKGKGVSFLEDAEDRHGKALDKGGEMEKALAEFERAAPAEGSPVEMRRPAGEPPAAAPVEARPEPPDYDLEDEVATRTAYGTALARLGAVDPRVVALDGDVKNSTRAQSFEERHPDRFIQGYIAEQNLVGMALGLQARGKRPFVASFACFLTRAFDFIRMAAVSRANLNLCGSHAGVSIGEDGPSQMGLEDIAMMRSIPGSVVLHPSDAVSAERLVSLAAEHPGISYIRTLRPKTRVLYGNDEPFTLGGLKVLRSSHEDRALVVAAGITVHEALRAHERLVGHRIPVRVVDCYSIKPIDAAALEQAARQVGGPVVTVEDHYAWGGLGDAVLEALSTTGVRVQKLAVRDVPRSGGSRDLLARARIDAAAIVETVQGLV